MKNERGVESADSQQINLTFTSMNSAQVPSAQDYGIIDKQVANKLDPVLVQLSGFEDVFFRWLEADVNNTILFAHDPIKAMKLAIPEFDESMLKNLKGIF
jgi:hypothetical protein